jgi:hypothetical protein
MRRSSGKNQPIVTVLIRVFTFTSGKKVDKNRFLEALPNYMGKMMEFLAARYDVRSSWRAV